MATLRTSAITVDTRQFDQVLATLQKDQLPYAKKEGLNALTKDTARVEKFEMQMVFARPTPFILGGMRVLKWANKRDPVSILSAQGDRARFRSRYAEAVQRTLDPQIEGGRRTARSSERRLRETNQIGPGQWLIGVETNAYGNVKGKEYQQMLSFFRAYRGKSRSGKTDVAGLNRAMGAVTNTRGVRYFVQKTGRNMGIYRVRGKKGKPKLIFYVTGNAPTYRPRFDFYGVARLHAAKYGGYFAQKAMDKALRTAR